MKIKNLLLLSVALISFLPLKTAYALYAEQCRMKLNEIEDNKYKYYTKSWGMHYLDMAKAQNAVDNLYKNYLESSSKDKTSFCKEEINELRNIYEKTTKVKEYFIPSASGDCLKLLQNGFCKESTETERVIVVDELGNLVLESEFDKSIDLSSSLAVFNTLKNYDDITNQLINEGLYDYMLPLYRTWLIPLDISDQSPESGWKMHVGLNKIDPAKTTLVALSLLRKAKIFHKLVSSNFFIEKFNQHETQRGKIIAIFPKDEQELVRIAKKLDKELSKIEGSYISPPFEAKIGSSGALTARYGVLHGDFNTKIAVVDRQGKPTGQKIPDSRKGEGWKKAYAPDFVNWNPFTEAGIQFFEPPKEGWPQ